MADTAGFVGRQVRLVYGPASSVYQGVISAANFAEQLLVLDNGERLADGGVWPGFPRFEARPTTHRPAGVVSGWLEACLLTRSASRHSVGAQ